MDKPSMESIQPIPNSQPTSSPTPTPPSVNSPSTPPPDEHKGISVLWALVIALLVALLVIAAILLYPKKDNTANVTPTDFSSPLLTSTPTSTPSNSDSSLNSDVKAVDDNLQLDTTTDKDVLAGLSVQQGDLNE